MQLRLPRSRWCRGALATAGILLALEALVRLLAPQPATLYRENVGGTVHLRPGVTFAVEGEGYRNVVVTNSQGFHDREHSPGKAAGVRRVVVLGDSMVEGVHVPLEQNLCHLLEKQLGAGYEVLNMGVAGAGQAHEYLILQDQGRRAAPDVVVLCFYYNDVYNNSCRLESKKGKPFFVERDGRLELLSGGMARTASPLLENPLWSASALYRLVARRIIVARGAADLVDAESGAVKPHLAYLSDTPPPWQEAWSVTRALVRAIQVQAASQDARLVVALLPGKMQVLPEAAAEPLPPGQAWDLEKPHRLMGEFCQEQHIPWVDLAPGFREAIHRGEKLYLPADEHFTAEGHALAARLIASKLRALGY